jgi:hypothetical protein
VSDNGEDRSERLDRELIELLNELRVALPGVQVLFGFLLAVPFSQGWQRVTDTERLVFFLTFLSTAIATVLLIAPSAQHRILWRARDKEALLRRANALALAGTVFLALSITGAVWVVTDVIYARAPASAVTAAIAGLFAWVWFAAPLIRRARKTSALVHLVHRRVTAGRMEEVLDALHALDAPRLVFEVLDQLGTLDLAAEDDDAVLGVDVDPAFRDVWIAKDLGFHLAGERGVVGIRELVVRACVLGLLDEALRVRLQAAGRAAHLTALLPEEREHPVSRHGAASLARVRVEEVRERGRDTGQREQLPHSFTSPASMAFELDYPDLSEANVIRRAQRREGLNRVRHAARSRPNRPPDGPGAQRNDAVLGPYERADRGRRRRGDRDPRGVRRAPAGLAARG